MSPVEDSRLLTGQRASKPSPLWTGLSGIFRSLVSKLLVLLLVFVMVPVILYNEFRKADAEKQSLLVESVREQGRLLAESLRPVVEREEPAPLLVLPEEVKRLSRPPVGIKVLFRPAEEVGAESFFFVAAEPAVPPTELEAERDRLIERGVFTNLVSTCAGELPIALRHSLPHQDEEVLTSITPINTKTGCWVVVTTHAGRGFLGATIGQPYWQNLEVRVAAAIYFAMALLVTFVFLSIWRSLTRFRDLARSIRSGEETGPGFSEQNKVPELALVAGEFDRMTLALQDSSEGIRRAAEDNAHAFKTPIAIMRQCLEPLRRIVPLESQRGQRALDVLEESVDRLDHLVACARQLDESTAELIDAPRRDVDISRLVARMLDAYANTFMSKLVYLDTKIEPRVVVKATDELLETVVENVIDNALSVAPEGSGISVELTKSDGRAELIISDQGPGVPEPYLHRIFERYISLRTKADGAEGSNTTAVVAPSDSDNHPGIGLWIVRRNLEAVGGSVRAVNRPGGGLAMIMRLPLAR